MSHDLLTCSHSQQRLSTWIHDLLTCIHLIYSTILNTSPQLPNSPTQHSNDYVALSESLQTIMVPTPTTLQTIHCIPNTVNDNGTHTQTHLYCTCNFSFFFNGPDGSRESTRAWHATANHHGMQLNKVSKESNELECSHGRMTSCCKPVSTLVLHERPPFLGLVSKLRV